MKTLNLHKRLPKFTSTYGCNSIYIFDGLLLLRLQKEYTNYILFISGEHLFIHYQNHFE